MVHHSEGDEELGVYHALGVEKGGRVLQYLQIGRGAVQEPGGPGEELEESREIIEAPASVPKSAGGGRWDRGTLAPQRLRAGRSETAFQMKMELDQRRPQRGVHEWGK
jgi:hypothetical protein